MKRTKKLLFVLIALFAISAASYAIEVSLGFSAGGGLPIMRGKDVANYIKIVDEYISSRNGDPRKLKLTTDTSIDVMLGFLPYLALETGVGYKQSVYNIRGIGLRYTVNSDFFRREIYIPVMLRGQYEYAIGATYLSAGVKVGFGLNKNYNTLTETGGFLGIGGGTQSTIKSSPVSLDMAFSLGQEFKVKQSHFLGLRFNYDLNVVAPYAVSDRDNPKDGTMFKGIDWSHDDLTVQFTYRYVFGRNK